MTKIAGDYGQDGTHMITEFDAWPLIPEEVAKEIQDNVAQSSAVLNLFDRLPNMSSRTYRMPVLSTLGAAEFTGSVVSDDLTLGTDQQVDDAKMNALKGIPYGSGDPGYVPEEGAPGLKQTHQMAWENVFIVAEPLAITIPVPDDVLDDSEYDIWQSISPKIREAFNARIDGAAVWGVRRPVSWPSGIVPTAIARNQVVVEGTGADLGIDISNLMGTIETFGFNPSGFLGDVSLKASLRNLRVDGEKIFTMGNPDTVHGLPIYYAMNGAMQTAISRMIVGDTKQAKYSIRTDMSFKIFDQAVITDENGKVTFNAAQQDAKIMRVVMRLGWAVPNPIHALNADRGGYPFAVLTR